jgi:hypothetical protein
MAWTGDPRKFNGAAAWKPAIRPNVAAPQMPDQSVRFNCPGRMSQLPDHWPAYQPQLHFHPQRDIAGDLHGLRGCLQAGFPDREGEMPRRNFQVRHSATWTSASGAVASPSVTLTVSLCSGRLTAAKPKAAELPSWGSCSGNAALQENVPSPSGASGGTSGTRSRVTRWVRAPPRRHPARRYRRALTPSPPWFSLGTG